MYNLTRSFIIEIHRVLAQSLGKQFLDFAPKLGLVGVPLTGNLTRGERDMKIMVIQRHKGDLEGIRRCLAEISPERVKEVIFTSNPMEVMKAVADREPTLVVSGQYFEPEPSLVHGIDLARLVKRVNPRALFYIFSTVPQTNQFVDGVIPKEVGTNEHRLLARILASELEKATPQTLRAAFPEIWI